MEVPPVVEKANGLPGEEVEVGRLPTAAGCRRYKCPAASTSDILKFLIDRTGYIKQLEEEDTPEAFSRVENLRELVNAAMDSRDRGETLDQFLDHAALVSDAERLRRAGPDHSHDPACSQGSGVPADLSWRPGRRAISHSRTFLQPDDVEEERRLCYVGMTRAMDTLILTRAVYRRRYGTDLPEASIPSRFLEEIPRELVEDLGSSKKVGELPGAPPRSSMGGPVARDHTSRNRPTTPTKMKTRVRSGAASRRHALRQRPTSASPTTRLKILPTFLPHEARNSVFPNCRLRSRKGKKGFRPGQKVRHPKYGEGTVYQREGEGEDAKITYNSLASV